MIKYNRSFLVDGGWMALIVDDIDTIIFYTFETNIKEIWKKPEIRSL